ncbi:T9SS type A sorting domain-containing protein [Flavobacteriaceae bacterium]|nr:T9SS type A sorting domain-containing protein [Flavobacteriaceae bacterium]
MKKSTYLKMTTIYFLIFVSNSIQAQYESSILFHNNSDQLVYVSDTDGNHIPDYSYVGYKNGEEALPNVAVEKQISAVVGDNTAHIQAAIDEVEALPLNANGHRGALLLLPGEYAVSGELIINRSGVVLRGSGDGEDGMSNTIIRGVGNLPDERTLIRIGTNNKSGFGGQVAGTRQDIISPYIPTGSRTIEVADASVYNVGDNIIIKHPSTAAWIAAVDNGGVGSDAPWEPNTINLVFNRYITSIEGNKIQVATPIYDILDRSLSQSYVYTYNGNSQLKECGVENLRIFVESSGVTGRDHVKIGLHLIGVDNSWVKGVTISRVSDQGVKFDEATRCSVIDTKVLDMHGPISGGWRYNFEVTDFCNNILFENCTASNGRHTFVANGASDVNGIVFTNCSSSGDYTRSESHRRWGQGILWDNITWTNTNTTGILGLHNRGSYGTGHGWTVTNGVAWNINAPSNQIAIQKPPIGQNYAIGCNATVNGDGPFSHPAGYIEGTGENLKIQSLYTAQLEDRTTHGVLPDTPGKLFPNDFVFTATEKYLELTWHDVSIEEDNYILERSSDGVNFQTIATLPENTETYTDTDLQQANYFYRLKATNTIGTSPASNTIQTNDFYAEIQNIYYVKVDGDGSDGLTEATAFTTIDTAVQTATDGDTIYVVGSINQSGSIAIVENLTFIGISNAVITGSDGLGGMYSITAANLMVSFSNIEFTGSINTVNPGGVILMNNASSSLTITNCAFVNNSTAGVSKPGGAISVNSGDLVITNARFVDNQAAGNGGAVNMLGSGNLIVTNSLFSGNIASNPTISPVKNGSGGGLIVGGNVTATISSNTFYNNTADLQGGGIYFQGGTNGGNVLNNVTFFENKLTNSTSNADRGAALRVEGPLDRTFTITNCLTYGNTSKNDTTPILSGIGIVSNVAVTMTNTLSGYIVIPALGENDTNSGSSFSADLTSSNLAFDTASGFVKYIAVGLGIDTPIDFGSDGNDVGAWDSQLVLSLDDDLKSRVSVYVNHISKTIEINHDLDARLSVELFNILGSRIRGVKNSSKTQSIDVSSLKTGIYILLGKSSGTSFSKKILIY